MAPHKKYKIIIRKNISLKKKGEDERIRNAPTQMPRDNGLNMRVKIRRKTK